MQGRNLQKSHFYRTKKETRRAFTLIELLVVISIISILAAILFPVFARAREQARKAACQSNLKQLGIAVAMYIQDHDEKYPYARMSGKGWYENYEPYAKSGDIWTCPTAGKLVTSTGAKHRSGGYGVNFCGMTTPVAPDYRGTGFGNQLGRPCTPNGGVLHIAEVINPSETIYAGDPASNGAKDYNGQFIVGYNTNYLPVLHGGQVGPFVEDSTSPVDTTRGGGNYLFADGHVKYIQIMKLRDLNLRRKYFDVDK